MTYQVKYTNSQTVPININEKGIDFSTDLSLFGRKRLEYGTDMNANLLHILENFACHENPSIPDSPDINNATTLSDTTKKLLQTPRKGQLWYNKTQNSIYSYNGIRWTRIAVMGDIAFNWGIINNGETLPLPISSSGYTFNYSECSWIVSLNNLSIDVDNFECYTNNNAQVTAKYSIGNSVYTTTASYLIVGIRGNINRGTTANNPLLQSISENIFSDDDSIPFSIAYSEIENITTDNTIDENNIKSLHNTTIKNVFEELVEVNYDNDFINFGISVIPVSNNIVEIRYVVDGEVVPISYTNLPYIYITNDTPLNKKNIKRVDSDIDNKWILIDEQSDSLFDIKSKKSKNSTDTCKYMLYAGKNSDCEPNEDTYFGTVTFKFTRKK